MFEALINQLRWFESPIINRSMTFKLVKTRNY